jgi:hypothetical protein
MRRFVACAAGAFACRPFRSRFIVFAMVAASAAACANDSSSPVNTGDLSPKKLEIVDLGDGQSLVRIDFEDAEGTPLNKFHGELDPEAYAASGIVVDSALFVHNPTFAHFARSGTTWLEGRWYLDMSGRYAYSSIRISFNENAPGVARGVRVHVGRVASTYRPWEFSETWRMTCYSGSAIIGTQSAQPPLPATYLGTPMYVPLEVRGESISHCNVEPGPYFVMDDIEVTFAAAGVTCTPALVTRGDEVVCRLDSTVSGSATRWEFEGDNIVNDSTLRITEAAPMAEWRGLAVESGTVTAVLPGGTTATGRFDVQDRSSGWNWDQTKWSYSQGTAADCDNTEPTPTGSYQIGWNRTAGSPKNQCGMAVRHRRILPILDLQPNAGYTVAAVPTGPNRGRWYVTSASFRMSRASNLNRRFLPGAQKHHISDSLHAHLCRIGMGLAPHAQVRANFYTFNKECMGIDVDAIIAGAWGHEGHGYNGGTGHEALAWAAAALPAHNPYDIERYTESTEANLRNLVRTGVLAASGLIEAASRDPLPTGNWPGGDVWMWEPATHKYVLAPLRPF